VSTPSPARHTCSPRKHEAGAGDPSSWLFDRSRSTPWGEVAGRRPGDLLTRTRQLTPQAPGEPHARHHATDGAASRVRVRPPKYRDRRPAQLQGPGAAPQAHPAGFDCSGFTGYVYRHSGKYLPRTSRQQYSYVKHITRSTARPGDLIFFKSSGGGVYHVGIFAGGNMLWQASKPGRPTGKGTIWSSNVAFGRV
jgi:cell wall-associated NlpC family hydrolase